MTNMIDVSDVDKVGQTIPHGSGIDGGWNFSYRDNKLVASNSFHTMNENGMYDGYADFTLIIPIASPTDFKLQFNGKEAQYLNRKYALREYLEDTFYYWLTGL